VYQRILQLVPAKSHVIDLDIGLVGVDFNVL
jgi:hypothetical protein